MAQARPRYQWYRHCEALADALEDVAADRCRRLMVFMPPRHGKSELVSRMFSAYYLLRHPERWVGLNSYAAELAYSLSRAARSVYRDAGGAVRADSSAVHHWETASGGGMWAAGVGGPITGKGFDLGIIDDPLKNAEDAASAIVREKQRDWYASTFSTREEPNGAQVVIQTRWHEEDLSGALLATERTAEHPEGWRILCLPAIADEPEPERWPESCEFIADWRQPGAPLCPERYPIEKLRQIEERLGGYFWDALYQQRPTPRGGSFFKVNCLQFADAAPAGLRCVRAWDLAATDGGGDWTVGVLMGVDERRRFWVLDVVRGQWAPDERDKVVRSTAQRDGHAVTILGPQDPGSAGKDTALAFSRLLAGYTVVTRRVTGQKTVRAEPMASQIGAGNMTVLRASWTDTLVEELRQFPRGTNDDQVDAASDAFASLTGGHGPITPDDIGVVLR